MFEQELESKLLFEQGVKKTRKTISDFSIETWCIILFEKGANKTSNKLLE